MSKLHEDRRVHLLGFFGGLGFFAFGFFAYLILFAGLDTQERGRVYVMGALFAAYAIFFAGFEQGSASLNLFAERYTDLHVFGWKMPAGVLQGATAFYTILFAPAFAALWIALGRRGKDFAPSTKFAAGLTLLAAGYLVMYVASGYVVAGDFARGAASVCGATEICWATAACGGWPRNPSIASTQGTVSNPKVRRQLFIAPL